MSLPIGAMSWFVTVVMATTGSCLLVSIDTVVSKNTMSENVDESESRVKDQKLI